MNPFLALVALTLACIAGLVVIVLIDEVARRRRMPTWFAVDEAPTSEAPTSEASAWNSWCELSDQLALDLAIATASRRIAVAYSSN